MILITIPGRVPSKKNSKQIISVRGRPVIISSKEYRDWEQWASGYLSGKEKLTGSVEYIDINFYFPDARRCDLTNKAESILDLLVVNGIIPDDNWKITGKITLIPRGIDREYPRVEIEIKEHNTNIGNI